MNAEKISFFTRTLNARLYAFVIRVVLACVYNAIIIIISTVYGIVQGREERGLWGHNNHSKFVVTHFYSLHTDDYEKKN